VNLFIVAMSMTVYQCACLRVCVYVCYVCIEEAMGWIKICYISYGIDQDLL
jgi:hypothetical protein